MNIEKWVELWSEEGKLKKKLEAAEAAVASLRVDQVGQEAIGNLMAKTDQQWPGLFDGAEVKIRRVYNRNKVSIDVYVRNQLVLDVLADVAGEDIHWRSVSARGYMSQVGNPVATLCSAYSRLQSESEPEQK